MSRPDVRGERQINLHYSSRRLIWLYVVAVLLSGFACSRKSVLEKASEEYDAGRYREAIFVIRHHFSRGGIRSPKLLLLEGRSWIRLGAEAKAEDAFAEAYSADSTLAPVIAKVLRDESLNSLDSGSKTRGQRLLSKAINYNCRQDFERYNNVAGELLLEKRDFDGAIYYFSKYLEQHADSVGSAEVMMKLGAAYEGKGEAQEAVELYRRLLENYPRSRFKNTVRWKLENLLLKNGEELYKTGEIEQAEQVLTELAASADNPLVREHANFMMGQIFEELGEIGKAVIYYTEVVNLNLGSSGRLVEKAKERIEQLEISRSKH